ncbi:MAG: biotin--[acetyl-CoA-carboxylase] ligase [SAR324 cluster bacterium]|uniref:Biotin--[acetyl-CoA-carboxylase] ligase n=1 Tax=SAR324 cluster bacterium TaxID=2024889 RepID=A0A7X9FQ81_9DELT|nr:biotin--[acetyl-CoA-carboxylase] ligase [SAR324 cluster bacterium]
MFLRNPVEEDQLNNSLKRHWAIEVYDEVPSTMDVAEEKVMATSSPLLILAKKQSSGRGRQGRVWESPEGGFYGTYAFTTNSASTSFGGFSLAVGLSLVRSLGIDVDLLKLKWPNDLVSHDGRKLGGILIDVKHKSNSTIALIGIGINLLKISTKNIDAISVEELSGKLLTPIRTAMMLSDGVFETFNIFLEKEFSFFKAGWLKCSYGYNRRFVVESGGDCVDGLFRDIGNDGSLVLETREGPRVLASGHIKRIYAADD